MKRASPTTALYTNNTDHNSAGMMDVRIAIPRGYPPHDESITPTNIHREGTPLFVVLKSSYEYEERHVISIQELNYYMIKAHNGDRQYAECYPTGLDDFTKKVRFIGFLASSTNHPGFRNRMFGQSNQILGCSVQTINSDVDDLWPDAVAGDLIGFAVVSLKMKDEIFDFGLSGKVDEGTRPKTDGCIQVVPYSYAAKVRNDATPGEKWFSAPNGYMLHDEDHFLHFPAGKVMHGPFYIHIPHISERKHTVRTLGYGPETKTSIHNSIPVLC